MHGNNLINHVNKDIVIASMLKENYLKQPLARSCWQLHIK